MSETTPVITGMGIISSLASTVEGHWQRILKRSTGITEFGSAQSPGALRFAGRVPDDKLPADTPPEVLKQARLINQSSRLALRAVDEAVAGSGLDLLRVSPARKALYIGASDHSKAGLRDYYPPLRQAGVVDRRDLNSERVNMNTLRTVNPFILLESLSNNLVAFVSSRYQIQGPNTTLGSHSPCGAQALELGLRSLVEGQADVAIVVGTCVWSPFLSLFEMDLLGLLSQCRQGASSFRPFDARRDGFIAGDGAAALVLEPRKQALARGARVFGSVRGSSSFTAVSPTGGLAVEVETEQRALTAACDEAGLGPQDLAFIVPHGNGTRTGDRVELSAITALLDGARPATPIAGMKPYTGHMGAASDIAEIALALTALRHGLAPATLNFQNPEPGFDGIDIIREHRSIKVQHALLLTHGLGGQSLATVVSAESGLN